MSEVNDVRAALERLGQLPTPEDAVCNAVHGMRQTYMLAQAIVSEGLAACERHEEHFGLGPGPRGRRHGDQCYDGGGDCAELEPQLGLLACILKKAGLL